MANGHTATTERCRLTIIGANTKYGSRCFEPWLPGIETREEWEAHLAGIQASLSPVGHLESELAYKVALASRQWRRLDRFERAATIQAMEEAAQEPFGEKVQTVMEAGVQALKERTTLANRLIEQATACPSMDVNVPITPSDGPRRKQPPLRLIRLSARANKAGLEELAEVLADELGIAEAFFLGTTP